MIRIFVVFLSIMTHIFGLGSPIIIFYFVLCKIYYEISLIMFLGGYSTPKDDKGKFQSLLLNLEI